MIEGRNAPKKGLWQNQTGPTHAPNTTGPKGLHRESAFRVAGSVQTSMHTQTHMFGALLDGGCREA